MLFFEVQAFHIIFLQILLAISTEISKVYFMFLISIFAIFNINNLNQWHRNSDVNRNHLTVKLSQLRF